MTHRPYAHTLACNVILSTANQNVQRSFRASFYRSWRANDWERSKT